MYGKGVRRLSFLNCRFRLFENYKLTCNNKYEEYIHKILKKLNKMDEKGLKHIDKYIDLYNETMEEG